MTTEPLRFRVGRRGTVHETRPGDAWRARCGVLVSEGEPTDDEASCRTCLGRRVWRGGPRRHRTAPATQAAADLELTEQALAILEEANAQAMTPG